MTFCYVFQSSDCPSRSPRMRRLARQQAGFSIKGCAALIRFWLFRPRAFAPFAGSGLVLDFSARGFRMTFAVNVSTFGRSGRRPAQRRPAPFCRVCSAGCGSLLLFAANGETVRTAVVVLGLHVGTVEAQVRPVHARRRLRRTAPGVTAFTFPTVCFAARPFTKNPKRGRRILPLGNVQINLALRSLIRTLACALDTPARQCSNKFGIALTYSYL